MSNDLLFEIGGCGRRSEGSKTEEPVCHFLLETPETVKENFYKVQHYSFLIDRVIVPILNKLKE